MGGERKAKSERTSQGRENKTSLETSQRNEPCRQEMLIIVCFLRHNSYYYLFCERGRVLIMGYNKLSSQG